jgi:hypothetical protein
MCFGVKYKLLCMCCWHFTSYWIFPFPLNGDQHILLSLIHQAMHNIFFKYYFLFIIFLWNHEFTLKFNADMSICSPRTNKGRRGIDPRHLNLSTKWRWQVTFLCTKPPNVIQYENEWALGWQWRSGWDPKLLSYRESNHDSPVIQPVSYRAFRDVFAVNLQ